METIDGIIPKTVDDKVQYKETFAPYSALKSFNQKIKRLTKNGHARLAPKVEIVDDTRAEPATSKANVKF